MPGGEVGEVPIRESVVAVEVGQREEQQEEQEP